MPKRRPIGALQRLRLSSCHCPFRAWVAELFLCRKGSFSHLPRASTPSGCQSPADSLIFMTVPSDSYAGSIKPMKYPSLYARIFGVAVVCLVLSLSAFAGQSTALTRGAIIERVVCRADASQSYALFLPASYTPQKRWPIIYCFDPAARGRVPL